MGLDDLQDVSQQLTQTNNAFSNIAKSYSKEFEATADRLARKEPSALAGTVGVSLAALGTIGLGVAFHVGVVVIITVFPFVGLLGASVGVLSWQNRKDKRILNTVKEASIVLQEWKNQIDRLPPDAPDWVRQELWSAYSLVVQQSTRTAISCLAEQSELVQPPGVNLSQEKDVSTPSTLASSQLVAVASVPSSARAAHLEVSHPQIQEVRPGNTSN